MANMRDIASLAKVSVASVSRILKQDPTFKVNEETRSRVLKIAKQLNYHNQHGKSFLERKTKFKIGLIVNQYPNEITSDPYFIEIKKGILKECALWGMEARTIFNMRDADKKWTDLSKYDAVLVIGNLDKATIVNASKYNQNLLLVDYYGTISSVDIIQSDFYDQTTNILDLFYKYGHRKIAYIGGYSSIINQNGITHNSKNEVRYQAYLKWMKLHDLTQYAKAYLSDWGPDYSYQNTKKLLNEFTPTAILVASDPMAIGVYKAIKERGLKIPQDISIFSFDDIESAKYFSPSLSSVHIDSFEMGKLAVDTIKARVSSGRNMSIRIIFNSKLVIRDSIRKIKTESNDSVR
ncbi:LacI family DNA-binding transcriptional regulator [uncultured Lactobacillus sp.]|uniref:LacI family DNA-binding transcriptional regulator n=1 Tax=uncultured Lactobacillus sp. TaxID=153152 RepID=UPI00261D75CE|nr:LacI family DNA-binding transcriptional regulator [uncultured Lactobacillus sp.]